MPSTPISDHPDLAPVFGQLDDDQRGRIAELLGEADARLAEAYEHLASQGTWNTEGVVLTTEVSGQASIDVLMEESAGKLTFEAQLRPSNYFPTEEGMWQPGRPPLVMATDGWDVDGAVSVRFRTRVAGRPYTIQEQVRQIEEARYDTPIAAAEAFAKACEKLAKLAASRDATVVAWKPDAAG
ncbi:MAG TPA: hypothetical protein VG265_05940 [Gaiellaceae bacterium]|jgi:hypothetical protein|nr:hypothetical protein [Gaiellaceae bacterium]